MRWVLLSGFQLVFKLRLRHCKIRSSPICNTHHHRCCSVVYVIISKSPETRLIPISVRAISMHKTESRETSNRKYLSKTILACRERQANNTWRVWCFLLIILKEIATTAPESDWTFSQKFVFDGYIYHFHLDNSITIYQEGNQI